MEEVKGNWEHHLRHALQAFDEAPSDRVWESLTARLDQAEGSGGFTLKKPWGLWLLLVLLTSTVLWASRIFMPEKSFVDPPLASHQEAWVPLQSIPLANSLPLVNEAAEQSQGAALVETIRLDTTRPLPPKAAAHPSAPNILAVARRPFPLPVQTVIHAPGLQIAPSVRDMHELLNPERKKLVFRWPHIPVRKWFKGRDWDYQIGLTVSQGESVSVVGEWTRIYRPFALGIRFEWVPASFLRLSSGFQADRLYVNFPHFEVDPVAERQYLATLPIDTSLVAGIHSLENEYYQYSIPLEVKGVLSPMRARTKLLVGIGTSFRVYSSIFARNHIQLTNGDFYVHKSKLQLPEWRFTGYYFLAGVEQRIFRKFNLQALGFFRIDNPYLRTYGLELSLWLTGKRGYFRIR